MKITSIKLAWLVLFSVFGSAAIGQYNWKLSKDEDGIKVYLSEVKHSKFKNIKVECTLEGTYDKLMAVLNDVDNQKSWVYNNISSSILKRMSANEFYYYTKTHLPWPMTNRDAVIHLKMNKDSLNRFLKISAVSVAGLVPEKSDLVRVPRSDISWYVIMPTPKTISIVYIFDAEPGGSLPAWAVNMFTEKGPYESFKKLSKLLK
ncbi:MAG: lipid-binding protein [Bacteroidetes bacterium]|nr:MAG: lipid-binding protein [Bacteroidota bacterium]